MRSASSGTWIPSSDTSLATVPKRTVPGSAKETRRLCRRLGIPTTSTRAEVVSAARRLVAECHPDRGGDLSSFQEALSLYRAAKAGVDEVPKPKSATVADVGPAWFKAPLEVLTPDEERACLSWLRQLVEACRDFGVKADVRAGIAGFADDMGGFAYVDGIAVIGRREASRGRDRSAEAHTYALMRMIADY